MRNLEDIEKDLTAAREALLSAREMPAEVYSRIVGYYRSVRNWNKGKREEYGERKLFKLPDGHLKLPNGQLKLSDGAVQAGEPVQIRLSSSLSFKDKPSSFSTGEETGITPAAAKRLILFVRPGCPGCPSAKDAAVRLGIPVDLVNADTAAGLTEAERRNVCSTPTAVLLSRDGAELGRAVGAAAIAALGGPVKFREAGTEETYLREAVSL